MNEVKTSMIKVKNTGSIIIASWLFVMMVKPDVSSGIKLGLLFLFILVSLIIHKKVVFKRTILQWMLVWEILFVLEYIYNWGVGNTFSIELFEIYLIRPVLLVLIAIFFADKDSYFGLFKILLFITGCIFVYNAIFVMQSFGMIPSIIRDEKSLVIISSSFLTIRTVNLTALMFLTPFMIMLCYRRTVFAPGMKKIIFLLAGGTIVISMLSGRRALQVITVLSIAVILVLFIIEKRRITVNGLILITGLAIMGIITLIVINNALGYNLPEVIKLTILDSLGRKSSGRSVRGNQLIALSRSWAENPVLGTGISSYSQYYMSLNGEIYKSWSYELFYNALLMQIGILGVTVVLFYVYKIIYKMYIFCKKSKETEFGAIVSAVIMGMLGFLICGSTNPMATSSWMWFIVLSTYSFIDYYFGREGLIQSELGG